MLCIRDLRLSINPEEHENGKEGCARLARRPFRSATDAKRRHLARR